MKTTIEISLDRIKKGNHLEFSHLLKRYSGELLIFSNGMLGDRETAEELVSDTFLKIWERRESITEIKDLKGYLFVSVRNRCLNALKKNQLNMVSFEDLSDYHIEKVSMPEDHSLEQDIIDIINNAVERLPVKCKMVFSLSKMQGFKNKEIAELLEISEKTVEYHLKTAIEKLCDMLDVKREGGSKSILNALTILFGII